MTTADQVPLVLLVAEPQRLAQEVSTALLRCRRLSIQLANARRATIAQRELPQRVQQMERQVLFAQKGTTALRAAAKVLLVLLGHF